MKWLCVHLPRLSLDVLRRADPALEYLATVESDGARRWIHDRDEAAATLGISPGMQLGTAYALAPHLRALPRDRRAEARALEVVALQAWRLSDRITLDPPDRVLVEIDRSRRLLEDRDPTTFFELPDYRVAFTRAPTPQAAALLARAARYRAVDDVRRLDGIDIACCDFDETRRRALTAVGVTRVGQLRALPRDGVRRRFGREVLTWLDRLTGKRNDPLPCFVPPEHFEGALDLLEETERAEALLFGASRLLRDLGVFLEARDLAVQRFQLRLEHAHVPHSELRVGLAEPDRSPDHLIELLRERVGQLTLPAPVRRLQLTAPDLVAFSSLNGDLFDPVDRSDVQAWGRLLERLRARLGDDAVRRLSCVREHAPEYAWRLAAPDDGKAEAPPPGATAGRPLWLLHEPRPVDPASLELRSGPERIETGWWDDRDMARDYYLARDSAGCRLWVYRECRGDRAWYLHGLFA